MSAHAVTQSCGRSEVLKSAKAFESSPMAGGSGENCTETIFGIEMKAAAC